MAKVGRPLIYNNCMDLDAKCELYFDSCYDEDKKQIRPYTVTGLALALNIDMETLSLYEGRPEFIGTVKRAKLRIENGLEEKLFGQAVAGVIFNLKNNFRWKDQKHVKEESDQTITHRMANTPHADNIDEWLKLQEAVDKTKKTPFSDTEQKQEVSQHPARGGDFEVKSD